MLPFRCVVLIFGGCYTDCSSIIESKSKVRHSRSKAIVAKVSTSASTSGVSPDVAELKDMVRALLLDKQTSPVPAPAPVKAVEQSCPQQSYVDKRMKPLEFSVGDYVLLKVSPWKGVVRFGNKGKLAPRFVGSFEIVEKVGPVAYRLDLPEELSGVHDMFYVSNLKKCLANPTLQVPLDEIRVDAKLNFV
ncbi:hypothetical protein Tco_0736478, partial [Tanacetum coccineum]